MPPAPNYGDWRNPPPVRTPTPSAKRPQKPPTPSGKIPVPQNKAPTHINPPTPPTPPPGGGNPPGGGGPPPLPPPPNPHGSGPAPGTGPIDVNVLNWPPNFGGGGGGGDTENDADRQRQRRLEPPKSWKDREGFGEKAAWFTDYATYGLGMAQRPEQLIEEGEKEGGGMGAFKRAAGHTIKGLGFSGGRPKDTELTGAGEFMEGAGSALSPIPGVGPVFDSMGKFGKQLMESLDKLKVWTNGLHEANMQFAEFSGGMAAVKANQEVRDMLLSKERGDRRAASAEYLAKGKNALEKNLTAPTEDLVSNIRDTIGGFLSSKLGEFAKESGLTDTLKNLNKWIDEARGKKGEVMDAKKWIAQAAAEGRRRAEKSRPPRMRQGGGPYVEPS